jgi:hypothetical protein
MRPEHGTYTAITVPPAPGWPPHYFDISHGRSVVLVLEHSLQEVTHSFPGVSGFICSASVPSGTFSRTSAFVLGVISGTGRPVLICPSAGGQWATPALSSCV